MGDVTDMIMEGILCEGCGDYMGDSVGYPRCCDECQKIRQAEKQKTKQQKGKDNGRKK